MFRKTLRKDDGIEPGMVTFMIMFPVLFILVTVVVGGFFWTNFTRMPVAKTVQTYTDLYAAVGTNTPARYQSFPDGQRSVTGQASTALRQIPYVLPGSVPSVVCGIADPTATFTMSVTSSSGVVSTKTMKGIRVPAAGVRLVENTPVQCAASVTMKPWIGQTNPAFSLLEQIFTSGYDSYGSGFSDGGVNANIN